jgi:hypothetical protein
MKVVHYTQFNASGMNRVAESIVSAERAAGLDSHLLNIFDEQDWSVGFDADVHVAHTHFPRLQERQSFRRMLTKTPAKIVAFFHGTPEFVFGDTVKSIQTQGHWASATGSRCSTTGSRWPTRASRSGRGIRRCTRRWSTAAPRSICIPMGIDHAFWSGGSSCKGRWAGNPSVLSCENAHFIKWPFDLITAWRWIYPQLENGSLNLGYVPEDCTGSGRPGSTTPAPATECAGPPRCGTPRTCATSSSRSTSSSGWCATVTSTACRIEANVAGARTISYRGNPHADYWVTEGDQRILAAELLAILRGDVAAAREDARAAHRGDGRGARSDLRACACARRVQRV